MEQRWETREKNRRKLLQEISPRNYLYETCDKRDKRTGTSIIRRMTNLTDRYIISQ